MSLKRRHVRGASDAPVVETAAPAETSQAELAAALSSLGGHADKYARLRRAQAIATTVFAATVVVVVLVLAGVATVLLSDRAAVSLTTRLVPWFVKDPEPPTVRESFTAAGDFRNAAYRRFKELRVAGERWGVPFVFHRPATTKYGPHQWLWDSVFHTMVSASFDLPAAVDELYTLLSTQDEMSGFVPEVTNWEDDPNQAGVRGAMFGYRHTSHTDLTQMPMFAYGVDAILRALAAGRRATEDCISGRAQCAAPVAALERFLTQQDAVRTAFLCDVLPKVHRALEFWLERRDPDGDGLVSIVHPWESGLDASPLYDDAHLYNRARRTGTPFASARWNNGMAAAGGDGTRRGAPTAGELYSEFVVLLYRYRHRAHWDPAAILDPSVRSAANSEPLDDGGSTCGAAFKWTDTWHAQHRRKRATSSKDGSSAVPPSGARSIVDGIFDVEDVAVNAVVAEGFALLAQQYDTLLDGLRAADVGAAAELDGRCCWLRDDAMRRSAEEKIAAVASAAGRARNQTRRLREAMETHMWQTTTAGDDATAPDRVRNQFVSFFHTYHREAAAPVAGEAQSDHSDANEGGACVDEHPLRRRTVQTLFPLIMSGLSPRIVETLVEQLSEPRFFLQAVDPPVGTVPTVARSETDVYGFTPSALLWRGPAWPTTTWFIERGLAVQAARFRGTALGDRIARVQERLLGAWVALHMRHGFNEYHSADDGRPLGVPRLGMSYAIVDALQRVCHDATLDASADARRDAERLLHRVGQLPNGAGLHAVCPGGPAGPTVQELWDKRLKGGAGVPSAGFVATTDATFPRSTNTGGVDRHSAADDRAALQADDDNEGLYGDRGEADDYSVQVRLAQGCCFV